MQQSKKPQKVLVESRDISTFLQPEAVPMPSTDYRVAAVHSMAEQGLKFDGLLRRKNRHVKVDKKDARRV